MASGIQKLSTDQTLAANGKIEINDIRLDLACSEHSIYWKLSTGLVVKIEVYQKMADGDEILVGTFDNATGTAIKNLGLKAVTRISFKIYDKTGLGGTVTLWFCQIGSESHTGKW